MKTDSEARKKILLEDPKFCLNCGKQILFTLHPCGSWDSLRIYKNKKYCSRECCASRFKVPEGYKRCSICMRNKKLDEFSPCKTGSFGLYAYCKECHRQLAFEQHPNRAEIDEKLVKRKGLRKLGLKTCSSCKTVKSLEDFFSDPNHTDGKWSSCKECSIQKNNTRRLKYEYNLTKEQHDTLLDAQDGLCAICGRAPKKNKFNIDHDHKTHEIRGLLCVNCNTNILPYIEAYPDWVSNAFKYLQEPPAIKIIGRILVPESNPSRKKDIRRNKEKENKQNA